MINYLELIKTPQSPGVPLRQPSSEGYDPVCQPGWHLPHVWGGDPRSEIQQPCRHITATGCLTFGIRKVQSCRTFSNHVIPCEGKRSGRQLTCQCPCRTALNSGTMPRLLGWATAAPCSSNRRQTSSFPRPEAAVRAGRTHEHTIREERTVSRVNVVGRN